MEKISLGQIAGDLNFRSLNPDIDVETVMISHSDINRPSLQLVGFFEHFDNHRIQIIGNVEMAYLRTLSPEKRHDVLEELFKREIPCLIYCRDHMPDEDVHSLAEKYQVPFLYRDFRPGFQDGQSKARELELYMQKYCGCIFSEEERYRMPFQAPS